MHIIPQNTCSCIGVIFLIFFKKGCGFMWNEKLKNGKVRYVERYKDPITLETKKVSIVMEKDTAANRKKALEELTRKIDALTSLAKPQNATLSTLYDNYIAYQSKTVKLSTLERNTRTLKKLITLFGPKSIIDNLTVQYINDKLFSTGCEIATLNEYLRRFKAMLNWAYLNDYTNNYKLIQKLQYFKEDKTHREKIKDKYLEPDEIKLLLKCMQEGNCWKWYYLTEFLVLSGLRIGEAVALNDKDVNDVIHITKTYDAINKVITTPKTLTSNRDVYIQPELETLIKRYRLFRAEDNLSRGISSTLFFNDKKGNYLSYYAYEKYLKDTSEKVLNRKITAHTLRHTHASLLLAEGVSIETISRRLGHENSKVTKEIYLHVTQKIVQSDNQQIKEAKIL